MSTDQRELRDALERAQDELKDARREVERLQVQAKQLRDTEEALEETRQSLHEAEGRARALEKALAQTLQLPPKLIRDEEFLTPGPDRRASFRSTLSAEKRGARLLLIGGVGVSFIVGAILMSADPSTYLVGILALVGLASFYRD